MMEFYTEWLKVSRQTVLSSDVAMFTVDAAQVQREDRGEDSVCGGGFWGWSVFAYVTDRECRDAPIWYRLPVECGLPLG
ncbi:MAG: hypothetical protein K2L49_02050 [Muribaculaceae bacterium]|nr:hypothetical protein [Muribaculaceae bacterium]